MAAPHRPVPLTLILLDDQLLAVNKPSGYLVGHGNQESEGLPELVTANVDLGPDEPFFLTHKLHEDVSGAVVYARTAEARDALQQQFSDGSAFITYHALVRGYVERDGEIDLPLHYHKRSGKWQASEKRGKLAVTTIRVLERLAGNTLLECRPHDERPDQLRAHLTAIGHPLTVDERFAGGGAVLLSDYKPDYHRSSRREERPLLDRLSLHAAKVTFVHPAGGQEMTIEAPIPRDLRATLTQLRRLV